MKSKKEKPIEIDLTKCNRQETDKALAKLAIHIIDGSQFTKKIVSEIEGKKLNKKKR